MKKFSQFCSRFMEGVPFRSILVIKGQGIEPGRGSLPVRNFIEFPHPQNSKNSPGAQKLADIQGISRVVWGLYTKQLLIVQMSQ